MSSTAGMDPRAGALGAASAAHTLSDQVSNEKGVALNQVPKGETADARRADPASSRSAGNNSARDRAGGGRGSGRDAQAARNPSGRGRSQAQGGAEPPPIPGLSYLQRLGSGGYADVFLYQQSMPARRVAVKVLRDANLSKHALTQFRAEVNAMATLAHPNIVPVYSASMAGDGRPYIVMMYYPRASLSERVKKERFTVAESIQLVIKLASAIETAHRAGILHRDVKPANVLTDQYGNPGLADFGIAAEISADDDHDLGISVPWSPPELLYATGSPSARSDVYSLAATLWHVLVGRSPFEIVGGDNSQFALMKRIRDRAVPETGRADVPRSLDRLLAGAMAKDPLSRPATALDFARSLQAIEQELRLPRTEIVVAMDESGHTVGRADLLDDATRMQPRAVVAQGGDDMRPSLPAAPPKVDSVPTPAVMSDSHGGLVAGVETATLHRLEHSDEEPVAAPAKLGKWIWGVVAVALVGVIVIIVVLLTRPKIAPPPVPTVIESAAQPDLGLVPPPGKLKITSERKDDSVSFSWAYDNALANDTYLWKAAEDDEPKRLETSTVSIQGKPAGQVCIWVRVVRFSGNNSQPQFTKGCTE